MGKWCDVAGSVVHCLALTLPTRAVPQISAHLEHSAPWALPVEGLSPKGGVPAP